MPAGDVNTRLNFNTRQFNTGLTAGQKRLEQFGESGIRIFERLNQVAQTFQNTVAGIRLPEIRPNVNITFPNAAVSSYTTLLDSASVSTTGLTGATQKLGSAGAALPGPLGQAGGGARQLGDESAGASPKVDRLYDALDRLQQVGTLLVTGAGLFTYFKRLEGSADSAQRATVGQNLFNRELAKQNRTAEEGDEALARLGDRFKINTSLIEDDAAGILRYGATLEQTEEIMLRAGASAVIRGRKFKDGSNAANEALNGEFSAALNLIGVSGNLSTYFQRLAKELDTTTDKLTRQQKVEAFLTLLREETGTEVEALSDLYVGYGAAQQRVSDQQLTAAQNTGQVVIPTLTLLKNVYADLLAVYNALPRPAQALAVATVTLGVVTGALVVGYVTLRALLLNQKTLGPVILDLLKNETLARGRVGAAILAQAQAYNLLSKQQLAQAQASVASARANAAGAVGATRLLTVLRTPIRGGGLLALGGLVVIVREAAKYFGVLKPVVDSVSRSFSGMNVSQLTSQLSEAAAGGQLFVTVFKNSVLYTVTAVALALEELNYQYERSMLVSRKWGQQARLDGAGAAETQREIDALKASHETNTNAILDSAAAYETQNTNAYLAASGLEGYASSTELAADGTKQLTKEAEALRNAFAERMEELTPEIDTSTLKGQVTQATEDLDGLIRDLRTEIEKLPLGDVLRTQLQGFLREAQSARKQQIGKIYAEALSEAQDQATDATLAAMADGAQKIEAERQRDLAAADKGFRERTTLLRVGSERYAQFLELYNAQVEAINSRAGAALEADAQSRLETARSLRQQIDAMRSELATTQAGLADDPLALIEDTFRRTSDQIASEVRDLASEVQQAYRDGDIDKRSYYAELEEIGRLGNDRLLAAEAQFTRDTREEVRKRGEAVRQIADAQARALAEAQVSGMAEGFEKERARFRLERQTRLDSYRQQLQDFQGTLQERKQLLLEQQATEVQLAQNNAAAARTVLSTALGEQQQTQLQYLEHIRQQDEEATRATLGNIQAVANARIAAAQERFNGAEGLDEQVEAYERLLRVQRGAVEVAAQFTAFERQRGASSSEITTALGNEAAAQRGVVSVIESQIDRLKSLRDAQLTTLESGSSVIELFREASKITGQKTDQGAVQAALQAQLTAQAELYRQQLAMQAPLETQLETLRAINTTREQAAKEGVEVGLSQDAMRLISDSATQALQQAPGQIQHAADRFIDLDSRIRGLGETLETATSKLVTLLEQAGTSEGLELKVTPVYDETALEAANKAVSAAFASLRAAQEEVSRTQREETTRTSAELDRARQALTKTQGDLAAVGRGITNTAVASGTRAGAGLMSAFASGVNRNRGQLLSAVDSVLGAVRARLPSSDARLGPLSDLTYSGGKLVTTFSGGMERKFPQLTRVAERMATLARPLSQMPLAPTTRAVGPIAGAGGAGGAGGLRVENMFIDGQRQKPGGMTLLAVQNVLRQAEREAFVTAKQKGF